MLDVTGMGSVPVILKHLQGRSLGNRMMEKAESADSAVSDCAKTTLERTQSDDAALPARIVVQNPAGDVTLGEDIFRLKDEVANAQKRHDELNVEAMQPGGERWAQVAYHQYWLSLCVTLQARKRLMLSPIGVDMGAMLWPVLSIILRQYDIHLGYEETLPIWALLSLSATCFLLDIATLLACSQDSQIVLVLVTVAHVPLYVSMFAANMTKNLWVITRLLVFVCALRVLAVLREITWLETQYHEGVPVSDGWVSRIIVWSLSNTAKRNRQQLLEAHAGQQYAPGDARDVDDEMVSVYIGSQSLRPITETSSSAVSSSLEGSSADGLPVPAPVSESAERPLRDSAGFARRTTDGCCERDSGAHPRSEGTWSRFSSAGESSSAERAAGIEAYRDQGSCRVGGAGYAMARRDACDASMNAATDARERDGLGGVVDAVVTRAGGARHLVVGVRGFLDSDDSAGIMGTADSGFPFTEDAFEHANHDSCISAELYGLGHCMVRK